MSLEQVDLYDLLDEEGVPESIHDAAWRKVRREAVRTVAELEPKKVADAFGITDTSLHHALAERNRTRLSAQQLVYLQVASKHITLASIVPNIRRHEVVPQKPLTTEEKLARWESLADQMGIQGDWMWERTGYRKVKP